MGAEAPWAAYCLGAEAPWDADCLGAEAACTDVGVCVGMGVCMRGQRHI